MKKPDDQPREDYDFRYGSRGRHHRKLTEEGALVRLDPDVAVRFPTSERIRERYDLSEGDALTLVDLDGAILLSPRVSIADKLSAEIEYLTAKACLSLDDLLEELRAMLLAALEYQAEGRASARGSPGFWRTVSRYITNDITAERGDELR